MPSRKKIVLFIAEGINDATSLALCMNQILHKESVHFEIVGGDITTEYESNPGNIAAKIGNIVRGFSGKVFKQSDFLEVVHLVDMDGAYIPDENIVGGKSGKNQYQEDCIETNRVEQTAERNRRKQGILDRMTTLPKVWRSIPYRVYYFSCNMDHVLHGQANPGREDKNKLAAEFEKRFYEKPEEFIGFFNSDEFSVKGSYEETWKFIKEDTNSLRRYSNFINYLSEKYSGSFISQDNE